MAKDELGTKRTCPVTGRKFYDLGKDPIVSPYTGESYPRSFFDPVSKPGARPAAAGRPAPVTPAPNADEAPEVEETEDVELVSLEDAEEDTGGKTVTSEDDIEVEDDGMEDDETFLEEEEEGDDDLSDVIGDGIEDDEER